MDGRSNFFGKGFHTRDYPENENRKDRKTKSGNRKDTRRNLGRKSAERGDVYTGTDTVEYLATGVPDRVFFATNKSVLTTAARDTLRKQAAWMRKKKDLKFSIEGHADERGTREYNLALGERRANAAKDYLMTYGISGSRLSVISYGKERPVNSGSNPLAWSQNRRSVTVKVD